MYNVIIHQKDAIMSFEYVVSYLAVAAGIIVLGGGILYFIGLLAPIVGQRVYRSSWPRFVHTQPARRLAYLRESAWIGFLLTMGSGLIVFGQSMLSEELPTHTLRLSWLLIVCGFMCGTIRQIAERYQRRYE